VTDSQLFPFSTTAGAGPFALTPKNSNNQTCLIPKGTVLDQTACNALAPSPQEVSIPLTLLFTASIDS
jgi:hypothetical protein